MGKYVERIKETREAARKAQEELESWTGKDYPEHLNDRAWEKAHAAQRAWIGKD